MNKEEVHEKLLDLANELEMLVRWPAVKVAWCGPLMESADYMRHLAAELEIREEAPRATVVIEHELGGES